MYTLKLEMKDRACFIAQIISQEYQFCTNRPKAKLQIIIIKCMIIVIILCVVLTLEDIKA